MKERPILFKGSMVLAVNEDRKSQTRRLRGLDKINIDPDAWEVTGGDGFASFAFMHRDTREAVVMNCPYGGPRDQLWVRETWRPVSDPDYWDCVEYKADGKRRKPIIPTEADGYRFHELVEAAERDIFPGDGPRWHPSIHMHRWASRIQLEVTDVRVERVQDISVDDVLAEGVKAETWRSYQYDSDGAVLDYDDEIDEEETINAFHALWDSINAKRGFGWDANPWTWAVTFKRLP